MKNVFVVTGFELGWDCVVGIYDAETTTIEELIKEFPEDQYYVQDRCVYSGAK